MAELGYIPASITAGESVWIDADNTAQGASDIIIADYTPAGGYTLTYQFQSATPLSVVASANSENTGWTLDVTGAQTLTLDPGRVPFVGLVTHTATSRVFAVDSGGMVVNPSPAKTSAWAAVIAAVDAAMLTVATNPNGTVAVDGMTVTFKGASDLISLRDYAQRQYNKSIGRKAPRRILARFP
jgi:hypothetical protein